MNADSSRCFMYVLSIEHAGNTIKLHDIIYYCEQDV